MSQEGRGSRERGELLRIIRGVRNRWRLRILLRGLVTLSAAGVGVWLLAAWGMEAFRFSADAVAAIRTTAYLLLVPAVWFALVRPLRRDLSDERVALYLEEKEPELDAAVLSALEAARGEEALASSPLVRELVASALDRARRVEEGRRIERRSLSRSSGVLAGLGLVTLLLLLFGPGPVRHGASILLNPALASDRASPYSIEVEPGNATVPRGADQGVTARLHGFGAQDVRLHVRTGEVPSFTTLTMIPAEEEGDFELLLFDLADHTEYFVESQGVRSPLFRLRVEDLPYVGKLELVYHFPSYTGLAPRTQERGGDIAVLRGTRVEVRARPTLPVPGGRVLLNDSIPVELAVGEEGVLVGEFTVRGDGVYRLELDRSGGAPVPGSPSYTIDALEDQPPSVRFLTPGRDTRPSPIEEVFLEVAADDDYGVRELELVYAVNGGEERSVRLFAGGGAPTREVTAGHTLYLEEYDLEAGDLVAYYARVRDAARSGPGQGVASDMYFLKIRPFGLEFREGDAPPGGGMGGPEGGEDGALSEQQRQVISATFNLDRDRSRYQPRELEEGVVTIGLAQGRVKDQVATLLQRMGTRRIVDMDPEFRAVAEALNEAAAVVDSVQARLADGDLPGALPHQQRVLQHLLRAEAAYREVTVTQQEGGGGGGGGGSAAEDLADLFELELDALRNQYETLQRSQQQSMDAGVDETLERLRELARRQEQEAERQRRRAAAGQAAAGSTGAGQRALAEETEAAARELMRLARERSAPELEETARQLQEAADAMRRSASGQGTAGAADAQGALDRLEEARRRLERERSNRLQRDANDALRQARQLARSQEELARGAGRLQEMEGAERMSETRRLAQRKEELAAEVLELERNISRMSGEARQENRGEAARALEEAAESLRDNRVADKLRFSRGLLDGGQPEYARAMEEEIGRNLEEAVERLERAAAATQGGGGDRSAEALDRARDLVRGLESMDRRLRERGEDGGAGEPGAGEPGEGGAPGGDPGQGGEGTPTGGEGAQGQPGGEPGETVAGAGGGGPGAPGGRLGATGGTPPTGAIGSGLRPPAPLSPEEARQLQREYRERAGQAEVLRQNLGAAGVDASELAEVIRSLRALDDQRLYGGNLEELARLQERALEAMKRFEYALRRELAGEGAGREPSLAGSDEVPEGFREWVEEYYRALARGGGR